MADEAKKYLDYDGLKHLVEKLTDRIEASGGDYLPLSGGTIDGDLTVEGATDLGRTQVKESLTVGGVATIEGGVELFGPVDVHDEMTVEGTTRLTAAETADVTAEAGLLVIGSDGTVRRVGLDALAAALDDSAHHISVLQTTLTFAGAGDRIHIDDVVETDGTYQSFSCDYSGISVEYNFVLGETGRSGYFITCAKNGSVTFATFTLRLTFMFSDGETRTVEVACIQRGAAVRGNYVAYIDPDGAPRVMDLEEIITNWDDWTWHESLGTPVGVLCGDGEHEVMLGKERTKMKWANNVCYVPIPSGTDDEAEARADFGGEANTKVVADYEEEYEDGRMAGTAPMWCHEYSQEGYPAGSWWLGGLGEVQLMETAGNPDDLMVLMETMFGYKWAFSRLEEGGEYWSSTVQENAGASALAWLMGIDPDKETDGGTVVDLAEMSEEHWVVPMTTFEH